MDLTNKPSANKTSALVQKHIDCLLIPAYLGIKPGAVEMKGKSLLGFVAILMKYQRMEEALRHHVENVCGHDKYTDNCDCKPMRDALAFDPLEPLQEQPSNG